MSPNHNILGIIDSGDFTSFVRILSDDKMCKTVSIGIVLDRLFANKNENINTTKFFQYIVNNNGKYEWNICDYSIIIGHCVKTSNIKLLKMIIDNVDKSKYNLATKFTEMKKHKNSVYTNTETFTIIFDNVIKQESFSILDFCIESRFINHNVKIE